MRIGRLDLLRYGRFTDVSLELPVHSPDVHVVLGPNEAGKSTALAAIEDVLFGIPHNSPLNFLHDYASMRIGAVLENDNETLEVRRRKGNKDTLLTPEEIPISVGDGALAPFLAGADRGFLGRMFSLDHARLRQGGREILEAQDEIGQMLFSAGAGLSGLRETLKTLAEEADGLWASRRSARRRYFQAEDRLKEADDALRAHTITAAKWHELKRVNDAAGDTYAALEREIEEMSAEKRKLGRIRRVYRNVRRKAGLDQTIADLGEATALPEDALQILQAAERDDGSAAARVETLTGQLEVARAERSALTYDEALILHEHDIEQIHERRIKVRDGRADLPKRRAELAGAEADLRRLAAELDWDANDVEQLIGRIPARAKVSTVRTLLNRRGERLSAVENAKAAAEEAATKVAELLRQREAQGALDDISKLAAVTRATRGISDIASRISAAAAGFENAQADFHRLFELLRPAVADERTLGASPVPPRDTVQTHRDSCRTLDQRIESCRERIRATEQELDRQHKAYERLAHDEQAVAPNDLALARGHRDTGWSLIRRRYVDGRSVPEAEISAFGGPENQLTDAYEAAVRSADDLADLRFDKAEAAARLAVTSRQIADQEEFLRSLRKEAEALDEQLQTLDAEWREMWSEAPFEPLVPDEMQEWLTARKEALNAIERRATAERQVAALRRQEAEARASVLDELATLSTSTDALAGQPLAVVLEVAADMLREHDRAIEGRRQLDEVHRQSAADAERKRKAFEKTEAVWSKWQSQWADALAVLGLVLAVNPEAVAVQVDTIDEMRTSVVKANELRHERIGKIERDVTAFSKDVAHLAGTVAPDLAELEPEEAVLQLERRLAETRRLRDLRKEKNEAIATLERAIEEYETARRDAREVIGRLQEAAGVTDVDQLKVAIEKSDRLRVLRVEQAQILDALLTEGDGLSVAELGEECKAVDLDQVSARETSLEQELKELHERLLEAREHRTAARQAFEATGGNDAAACAAAARQEALAEMRAVAEQYTRVRVAALLLQWAIDRYRREKQVPLLKRAGQLFATLTGGSFGSLRVDFDDQDRAHLIGVRPDGAAVPVPGMSTGTADQLYLALRIASVTDYLDRAPPLPFVADDLFINFDDERAAAGFRVLGQLGIATQVLFFTHHKHLVDIAHATLGATLPIVSLEDEPERHQVQAIQDG